MTTDTKLQSRDEIAEFAGRNWRTIEKLIKESGFPAFKILGRWESDKTLIDNWRRRFIENKGVL